MFPSLSLGRILGFPVRVNASFLLMLAVFMLWPGDGTDRVLLALLAGASVILHELGHAVMARRLGVPVSSIELHFFGGAAQITDMPRRPNDEIAIAAAGPAVSFALAALSYGLLLATGAHAFALATGVNLLLGVFNLLPAFPSDGGRILRAYLARKRGLVRATELAVTVGRWLCAAMVVYGLAEGSFQLIAVAVVLWLMGSAERLGARMRGDRGDWRGKAATSATSIKTPEVEYYPPGVAPRTPFAAMPRPNSRPSTFPGAGFRTRDGRVILIWQR
jgi:Zn-dependent protease